MLRTAAIAVASLVALVASAGCAAPSSHDGDEGDNSEADLTEQAPHVLALGDSITFAWDPRVEKDVHEVDPRKYSGYAEIVGAKLGRKVDNMACPGETSGAMLDPKAEDNGCRSNRAAYSMHYAWNDATQIAAATAYLAKAVAKGAPPELVTLTIGGNDLLVLQKHCMMPSLVGMGCKLGRLPFYVHGFGEHIQKIVSAIDATGYAGTLVILSTYAPDYSDHIASFALERMNAELKEHVEKASRSTNGLKVRVADGYGAFKSFADAHGGKTCATGLLVPNGDGTCDIHPTKAGHEVLAKAVLDAAR